MASELKLPELGENVEKGDVVRVLVAKGDAVRKDQPVLELETDKATIEVPSSLSGTVTDVRVKAGDQVKVGQVVLVLDTAGATEAGPEPKAPPKTPPPDEAPPKGDPQAEPARKEPPTKAPPVEEPPRRERTAAVVDFASGRAGSAPAARAEVAPDAAPGDGAGVPAAPSVRRFARELGVDLATVAGSGPGGRIGQEDVKAHVKAQMSGAGAVAGRAAAPALPDFSRWGEVESRPMSNIRRKTAEHLSAAWLAPHVTQHDKADVTAFEQFRAEYGRRVEAGGGKLTITAALVRIVAAAIAKFPQFASSVDMARDAIVYKKYVHIGIAVDTPNGLLVPVIRDADRKTITAIAAELSTLSQKARDRKLGLDEMAGGVFSITNLGGIGGTSFTPIVNQPEVAILGVSRTQTEPVWRDDAFVPRQMLPLSLSYDHRVIDGADAARFLRFVVEALEQPLTMLL
ncbi:MAG: 2-oxo acid dehydrogenase subunit E2 [Vicinamibacterales bacterium]